MHLIWEYNAELARHLWMTTLFCILCLVIGLLGNGYILYIYAFKLEIKGESRYFIPHLAIADFLSNLFMSTSFTYGNFNMFYFPWDVLCKGGSFVCSVPTIASPLFLLSIAIQRYTKTNPTRTYFSLNWRRATAIIIWTVSVCFSIPFLFITGVGEIKGVYRGANLTSVKCHIANDGNTTFFIVLAVVLVSSIAATLGLWVSIAVVVYRRQRTITLPVKVDQSCANMPERRTTQTTQEDEEFDCDERENSTKALQANEVAQMQTVKVMSDSTRFNIMFFVIVLAYLLSFVPTGIMVVINQSDVSSNGDEPVWKLQVYGLLTRFFIINNVFNPFIYSYFDMQFRQYIRHLLPCFLCR